MKILGLDLGQSKTAWELLDTVNGDVSRGTVTMDTDTLTRFLAACAPDLVALEIGPLAARVHDLAQAPGRKVLVADTTEDAWKWKNVKRKTDADDAAKLVRLALLEQINPVHIPTPRVRAWRQLLHYRAALAGDVAAVKNRIRAALRPHGLLCPTGAAAWSLKQLAYLKAQVAQPLAACAPDELWRGIVHQALEHLNANEAQLAAVTAKLDELAQTDPRIAQLQSIPGIGPRTAETLVATLDQPRRFKSRRQVSAYAGLVPRRYQSGQMDRTGRITKRGSPLLRQLLNQAAWCAVRCNPHLRLVYERVGGRTKQRRKQAIVAVMRKLLVLSWALLRDGTRYRPPPRPDPAASPADQRPAGRERPAA